MNRTRFPDGMQLTYVKKVTKVQVRWRIKAGPASKNLERKLAYLLNYSRVLYSVCVT